MRSALDDTRHAQPLPPAEPRYQRILRLGEGGMAEVYLAALRGPTGFNKLVVLKQLKRHMAEDTAFLQLFTAEARVAARLHHPNVVQTYEIGSQDDAHFIAMEYLDGQPLHRLAKRASAGAGLSLPLELHILREVLAGLAYAHELGDFDGTPLCIVHRDVSPQNVFVTYDGYLKLLDFGVAKSGLAETAVGVVKGKLTYMAPEQAMAQPIDHRADIFSVGVMLWEMLTGRRLWAERKPEEILLALRAGALPRARSVNRDVPAQLDAICAKAMAASADQRFASASEFKAALDEAAEALGFSAGARELGELARRLFSAERSRARVLVEASLARLKESPSWAPRDIPLLEESARVPPSSAYVVTSDPQASTNVSRSPRTGRLVLLLSAALIVTLAAGVMAVLREPEPPTAAALATPPSPPASLTAQPEPEPQRQPPPVASVSNATAAAPAPRAKATASWVPAKPKRTPRKIDTEDPWAP